MILQSIVTEFSIISLSDCFFYVSLFAVNDAPEQYFGLRPQRNVSCGQHQMTVIQFHQYARDV